MGSYSFYNFDSLSSVTFSSSITTISEKAFYDCNGITSITLPSSLKTIGSYAFCYTRISSITLPSSLTEIGSYTFYSTGLTSINNTVTHFVTQKLQPFRELRHYGARK